jgi:hypothetical protein
MNSFEKKVEVEIVLLINFYTRNVNVVLVKTLHVLSISFRLIGLIKGLKDIVLMTPF